MRLLILLLVAGCAMHTSPFRAPEVDKSQRVERNGRLYLRPQPDMASVARQCKQWNNQGCLIIKSVGDYQIGFAYYVEGDEVVKQHEIDHWHYGMRHE